MRIWVIATGEPWPTDAGKPRLLRAGIFARYCAEAGDEVVWWNSTYDHRERKDRFGHSVVLDLQPGLRVRGLHSPVGYRRSTSFLRMLTHLGIAADFRRQLPQEPAPDVIFCCMPLIELCFLSARYGQTRGIPVVIDIRDLWPDIWLEAIPASVRPAARAALAVYDWMLSWALKRATGVTAVSDASLDWGLRKAGRVRGPSDAVVPLAYEMPSIEPAERKEAELFWDRQGAPIDGRFTACFVGALSERAGADLILDAAEALTPDEQRQFRFVIAGDGDALRRLQLRATSLPNVILPGWIDAPKIAALKERSHVGFITYQTADYDLLLPNKVLEYWAGGLPVISFVGGELRDILEHEGSGFYVEAPTGPKVADLLRGLASDPQRLKNAKDCAAKSSKIRDSARVYPELKVKLSKIASDFSHERKSRQVL